VNFDTLNGFNEQALLWRQPHRLEVSVRESPLAGLETIRKVQDLLGHRHITTTKLYDKRRHSTVESASHDVPI
jgi:site-specific recombinase XerC